MRKTFVRFCVLQSCWWGFQAAMPGYMTARMTARGIGAAAMGTVLAANLLCVFLGCLFWGRWVDRHQGSRRYYLIGNAATLLSLLLWNFADSVPLLMILYPLFGFLTGAVATVLDAWVIASFPERRDAGSRSRSFATLTYAFVMLATGRLIPRLGYGVMPVIGFSFLAVSALAALGQSEVSGPILPRGQAGQKGGIRELLNVRVWVLLVGGMFFTGMCAAPINNMKVLILESVGGDVGSLGLDSFVGCMVQAPFLLFSGRLQRICAGKRLILGAMAAMGYAVMVMIARAPALVTAGTILNNVSFGLLYPAMRQMTEENVPARLRNTAHSLVDVAYGSLSGMAASAWGGMVMGSSGKQGLTAVCIAFQCVSLVFCTLVLLSQSRGRRGEGLARRAAGTLKRELRMMN